MARRKGQRNVEIKANTVQVNSNQAQKKPNPKKQSKRKRNRQPATQPSTDTPIGIATGMSMLSTNSFNPRGAQAAIKSCLPLSDQSKEFTIQHLDPCGESINSLDAARVPDGAFATSAGVFFRSAVTVTPPFLSAGAIPIDGRTYSMLALQSPLFRLLTLLLVKPNDGEFDPVTMSNFCKSFANLVDRETATYPNWVDASPGSDGTLLYSLVDTSALRNIVPPPENGVSGTIDSYRTTSIGMNLMFNVPDLLNQGTFISHKYPTNFSTREFHIENPPASGVPVLLEWNVNRVSDTVIFTDLNRPGEESFPVFTGLASGLPFPALPATFIAPHSLLSADGTWACSIGQTLQYRLQPGEPLVVELFNQTTTNTIPIARISTQNGVSTQGVVRFYNTSTDIEPPVVADEDVSLLVLPPITQADIIQQNPKAALELLKECDGVYIAGGIQEPVFNVTHAAEYRKVVYSNAQTSPIDLLSPGVGYYDTVDHNFSTQVVNMQGIPYACKMLLKLNKTAEVVPAADSIIGAFTTGCPNEQPEVIDICKAVALRRPHGVPPNENFLGALAAKTLKVIEGIEQGARHVGNISFLVRQLMDGELEEEANITRRKKSARQQHLVRAR